MKVNINQFTKIKMQDCINFARLDLVKNVSWSECLGKAKSNRLGVVGQSGGHLSFKMKPFILGSLHSSIFLSDGPIKLAHCRKKILNLGGTSANE